MMCRDMLEVMWCGTLHHVVSRQVGSFLSRDFTSCCVASGWSLCVAGLHIMLCRDSVVVMCRGTLHHVVSQMGGSYVSWNLLSCCDETGRKNYLLGDFTSCCFATGLKLCVAGLYIMLCRIPEQCIILCRDRLEVMWCGTLHHVVSHQGGSYLSWDFT